MSRNVLVVALDSGSEEEIRTAIEARQSVDEVSVHVVAPASTMGPLQWLMGDEDEARAEAEEVAEHAAEAAEAVETDVHTETEVGDRDPLVAVEDALADFPADEIVVAGHPDEKTEARLRRFGLPVERLDARDPGGSSETEELAHDLARGRRTATPFAVILGVGAVVLGAAAVLSLLLFLVSWLV
jgi:hypothetical protein